MTRENVISIPYAGADSQSRLLEAVLQDLAPEVLKHPDKVAQIKRYVFPVLPGRQKKEPPISTLQELKEQLIPLLRSPNDQYDLLSTSIEGMRALVEYLEPGDLEELDAMIEIMQEHAAPLLPPP